jgi:hypothetical protein
MRTEFLKPSSTWTRTSGSTALLAIPARQQGVLVLRSSAHLKPISRKLSYLTVALTSCFRNGEQRSGAKSPCSLISPRATLWSKNSRQNSRHRGFDSLKCVEDRTRRSQKTTTGGLAPVTDSGYRRRGLKRGGVLRPAADQAAQHRKRSPRQA